MRVFAALIAWLFLLALACVCVGLLSEEAARWVQSIALTVTAGAALAGSIVVLREAGPLRRPTLVMLTAGLGYLWLALGPVLGESLGPHLITSKLLEIYAVSVLKSPPTTTSVRVFPAPRRVGNAIVGDIPFSRPAPLGPFRVLGHLWFGWFAAVVAMWAVARFSEPLHARAPS